MIWTDRNLALFWLLINVATTWPSSDKLIRCLHPLLLIVMSETVGRQAKRPKFKSDWTFTYLSFTFLKGLEMQPGVSRSCCQPRQSNSKSQSKLTLKSSANRWPRVWFGAGWNGERWVSVLLCSYCPVIMWTGHCVKQLCPNSTLADSKVIANPIFPSWTESPPGQTLPFLEKWFDPICVLQHFLAWISVKG